MMAGNGGFTVRAGAAAGEWQALRALAAVSAAGLVALSLTAALAAAVGAPFVLWFADAYDILVLELAYLLGLGLVWDFSVLSAALARRAIGPRRAAAAVVADVLASWRALGFFSRGALPLAIVGLSSLAIIASSNLTLINLELLKTVTAWRDPWLWAVEGPLFERVSKFPGDVLFWDKLYHSAWALELLAVFALILLDGKDARHTLRFCVSMILLFYVGRLLGLLNPVMGPAFHQPQYFGHLDGTISGVAVQLVEAVMTEPGHLERGAVLLGGVSAMPSLHVGMVALAALWLAAARRWTLLLTLPWLLLVWTATVILGWHYALDGVGGIALALACAALTQAGWRARLRHTP